MTINTEEYKESNIRFFGKFHFNHIHTEKLYEHKQNTDKHEYYIYKNKILCFTRFTIQSLDYLISSVHTGMWMYTKYLLVHRQRTEASTVTNAENYFIQDLIIFHSFFFARMNFW